MKKSESYLDIKYQKTWDLKTFDIEIVNRQQEELLVAQTKEMLSIFDEKNKTNLNPKEKVKIIMPEITLRKPKKIPLARSSGGFLKPKIQEESKVTQFFNDLDSQLLSISQGKISLSSVDSKKQDIERTEVSNSLEFDLDNKFSQSFNLKLGQLKLKEENFKKKANFRIKKRKKIIMNDKLATSMTNILHLEKQLPIRSLLFATSFPAILRR